MKTWKNTHQETKMPFRNLRMKAVDETSLINVHKKHWDNGREEKRQVNALIFTSCCEGCQGELWNN